MEPIIGHIQITVGSLGVAEPFYDSLMPLLGFDLRKKVGATIVSPPQEYPQHSPPGYHGRSFKDPEGIKHGIVCTRQERAQRRHAAHMGCARLPRRFPLVMTGHPA